MITSIENYSHEEVVTDILSIRLPVKSLLRFKCVCKSWHDLIKSQNFIKKHFNSTSSHPRLLICKFGVNYTPQPPLRDINFFLFPKKIIAGIVPSRQRIFRCEGVTDFSAIHGPIDGLFLLEKGHFLCNIRFAWWNPATKECRIIPMLSFELERFFDEHGRVVGIGYNSQIQDYKVLSLRTYMNDWKRPREVHPKVFAAIYSSNYDSWKHIEPNFAYENRLCDSLHCTHLKGVYYWLCVTKDDVYIISTFDFTTELFGEMVGPQIPNDHSGWLMLRGGSLAAMSCNEIEICETTGSTSYDIWARIRENNWIKVVTVTPPITWHSPIGIWEYDKYIYEMMQTYNLVYYDHTTKQVTDFGLNFSEIGSGFVWPISYKESLVPINRENPTEQDNIDYFFTLF